MACTPDLLAEIEDLRHNATMAEPTVRLLVDASVELLEKVHFAAADGRNIHNLCCATRDLDEAGTCSCGTAAFLRELATLLPLPPGAMQPYRPEWTPAAA